MASSSSRAHETHVLLVEHDSKDHDAIGDLLHYFSYKVTSVKLASTAISILSKGKSQFDMVLANLNSPDFYGPQLLQEAAKMDLLVFCEYSSMLSDDDNVVTSMSAIEQGAILCMRKTMMMQMIGYLWQYVLRERTMRSKQREKLMMMMEFRNGLFGDEDCTSDDMNNEDGEARKSNEKAKGVKIGGKDDNSRDKQDRHDGTTTVAYKRKIWTEWTLELHEKFVNAVLQLGEGNCYPKEILELMNVPGLTRMQVASHLQRCRHGKWLPPHLRKFKPTTAEPKPPKAKIPRAKQTRFGCMPHVDQFTLSIQEYQKQLWNNQEHTTNPTSTENTAGQLTLGEDGSFPIEPCYFGTPNVAPIANISSNQSDRNGDQNAFQFPSVDEIDRHFASLQQELGMDYNGSWLQALLLDTDYHSQIANVTDANNKKEMPEPGNDDEETER